MIPIYGRITPHARVCGAIFLFIAAVVGPLLHFAVSLAWSPRAGQLSIWALLLVYLSVALMPGVRRVSAVTSWIVLVFACFAAAVGMTFSTSIKDAAARATGFYGDALPWKVAQVSSEAWTYRQPAAGYSLALPPSWQQLPGPTALTHELVRPVAGSSELAARLRPGCEIPDEPLPMYVHALSANHRGSQRQCGHWQGMEACLLRSTGRSADGAERWEWLAAQRQ